MSLTTISNATEWLDVRNAHAKSERGDDAASGASTGKKAYPPGAEDKLYAARTGVGSYGDGVPLNFG